MALSTRLPLHNLAETIHSLIGEKSNLTSSWVKSVCHIITNLPSAQKSIDFKTTDLETISSSENHDDDLCDPTSKIRDELSILTAKIDELNRQRKQVLNEFLDLKGNIRVFCRIRPIELGENFGRFRPVVALDSRDVLIRSADNKNKSYSFDKVFHHGSSQDEVFSELEPVIKSALDGYNACIFAYGQTGTGKTFTMEGTPDSPGVVPCAIEALFKQAMDMNHVFLFSFSMLEIYMGNLRDLLIPQATDPMPCLSILSAVKDEVEIENLVAIPVSDLTQALKLYKLGCQFRSTASTNCNITSSRSHCLIRISITCKGAPERHRETNKVWFVDLGGSERLLKTKASGRRLEEGKAINLSLSALGDVINALQIRKGHIPYRNSKLTQVLKDSLGKDSKTLMLVHVSPKEDDLGETICSLNFATRVRSVHLGNTDFTEEQLKEVAIKNLQEKMNKIEAERQDVRMRVKQLNEELDNLTRTVTYSSEQLDGSLDAHQLVDELPQLNAEICKHRTTNTEAGLSSQVPRFMRPTVCSRRKYGSHHLTSDENLRFPARRGRPLNHHARSVNLPVKAISVNNSGCSISRNSCLLPLNATSSADVETEYSQDLSECDIKEVVFPELVTPQKCSTHHRYHLFHREGCEIGDKNNACSPKNLKVDKWLSHKNVPENRNEVHRKKRVLAIPTPEKKPICRGKKIREILKGGKVNNSKFAMKQIVNHKKLKNYADVEESERFIQEMVTKNRLSDSIHSRCNSDSSSDGIVRETVMNTKHRVDDVPMEKHTLGSIFPPAILCSNFSLDQDDTGVDSLSTMQAIFSKTQCTDSLLCKNSNWCKLSTSNLAHSILDSREDSSISISRIEQKSGCQQLPIIRGGEDNEMEDLDKFSQSSEEGTRPCLQKMRSQIVLSMENTILMEPVKPQQMISSQENNVNLGICQLLQQKIHIIWAGALLGLGFQNLGLEQEFFLGLTL